MATEFDTEVDASAEDFQIEQFEKVRPVTVDEINRAAISVMAEADPVGTFVQINRERTIDNSSLTHQQLVQNQTEQTKQRSLAESYKVLAREDLGVEEKKFQLDSLTNGESPVFETRNIAATNLISKPSKGESIIREEQNIDWAKNIAAWNDFVDYKQKALASFVAQTDGGNDAFKDWADIATFLVPFVDPALRESVAIELAERGLIDESQISQWGSPSTNQEAINSTLSVGDLAQRKKAMQEVLDVIDNSTKGFLNYDNDFAKIELARAFLDEEYWGDFEGALGDATLVLDFFSIVFPALRSLKIGGKAASAGKVRQVLDEVRADYVKKGSTPNSPAEMARHTNREQAKKLHTALEAEGEEFAKSAYGTDKASAMLDDMLPDPFSPSGEIRQKITNVESFVDDVEKIQLKSGRTVFTDAEKQEARLKVINQASRPSTDLVSFRVNQSTFGEVDDAGRFRMDVVFGATDDTGFVSPQAGIDRVLYANKDRGITKENLIVLKKSEEGKYIETTFDDVSTNDYLIKMKTVHELNVKDIKSVMAEDTDLVRSSLLDMVPGFKGKATGYVKVMESIFDRKISQPVLAESERGTLIREVMGHRINSFVDQFKKLDEGMQTRVDSYLRKANLEGIKFSQKELAEQGFTKAEIDTVATFRQFYDDVWVLDNKQAVKEFNADGFGILEGFAEDSRFIAKPISRIEAGTTGRVYVVKTGEVMSLTDAAKLGTEFDELQMYRLPGEARTTVHDFEYVLSEDKFFRGMNNTDIVKPYREGYYTVDYTDPFFIVKEFTTDAGVVRTKAVATAGDVQSAKREVDRLLAEETDETAKYFYRTDKKDPNNSRRQVDMEHSNYNMKFRGSRLLSTSGVSDEVLRAPIKDPLSAMVSSADKLSKRLSMGETYQGIKARFLKAFEDVLPQGQYPVDVSDIVTTDPKKQKLVDQAKVMYNWMESLQRPDPILFDEGFKKTMTNFANSLGESGWTKAENVARASSQMAPIAAIKSAVFNVFVALNPPRQLTLAVADSLKTAAIAPKYVATGQIFRDSTAMTMLDLGVPIKKVAAFAGRPEKELIALKREFRSSGLSAGIQQQARVQKGVSTATDELPLKEAIKDKSKLSKVRDAAELAGFQTAERVQNLAGWLAFREAKAKSAKRFNLTRSELDEITAQTRHFAYSQTKEAAPSYNTSVAATVMQFAGVIHKGISLTLPEALGGSRILTGGQKAKLWTFLLGTYGVSLTQGIDEQLIKIENETVRETLRSGLLWMLINKTTGASISTKNLNPADYSGFAERVYAIANADWANATPALGLINKFKLNAQVASGLWGDVGSDALELDTADKVKIQLKTLAEFFPAASNFMKGQVYAEIKRSVSKHNYTKDAELTVAEQLFKSFGFQTKEEEDRFLIRSMRNATLEEKKADVKSLMEGIRAVASLQGISNEEVAQGLALSKVFWTAYKKDPDMVDMVDKELKFLLTNDDTVYQRITSMVGIMEPDDMKGIINIAPMTPEERQQALDLVDGVVSLKGEIE